MQVVKPPRFQRFPKRPVPALLLAFSSAAVWLGLAGSAWAYLPPLETLYEQLVANPPSAVGAILDFQCRVYPITASASTDPAAQPAADPVRSFRQRVYWLRGRFVGVETTADDGTLLHVMLREGGFTQSAQVSATRRFSDADVRPLIFPFLEGKASAWIDELTFWGVTPKGVDLVLLKAAQTYRLTDDPDRALFLERDTDRPLRLSTRIDGGAGPAVLSVEFSDFISFATKGPEKEQYRIPRRMRYALNGKVFKDVQMTEFQVDPQARNIPLQRLRQIVAAQPQPVAAGKPQ